MMEKFMDIARVVAVNVIHVDYILHLLRILIIDTLKTRTKKYILRNDYLDFEFIMSIYKL